jgi:hypothetical protein
MPQYMLLIYGDPADAPGPDEQEAQHAHWMQYTDDVQQSGAMVSGAALERTETATTVRVRDGETLLTDGPFAETKEILGGYYVVDVPDLDAALALASKMPNIEYGSVEVRPLMVLSETGAPVG